MNADDLPLMIAWFSTAMPKGPALGDPERNTWANFCGIVSGFRRHGKKDGAGFAAALFNLEADGRQVRRKKENLLARTAIALDIETSKTTGELPPTLDELVQRIEARGWAAVLWTSHNHGLSNPRYRIVTPLSRELDPELPAVDVIAAVLGVVDVFDTSKRGAESYFYLPSCPEDSADLHEEVVVVGAPIDAAWLVSEATALLEARKAEEERQAAEAHAAAQAKREARLAAGFDPSDSLIEKIRPRLGSLDQILRDHSYDCRGYGNLAKYRHPNSQSGSFGANVKTFGGLERVYSHNAGDPLHAANLPDWCTVSAIDAFDATAILEFGGDRKRALRELAERFGLSKREENRAVARLIYQLCREQAPQKVIETRAYAEGERLGLTRDDVIRVAIWIAAKAKHGRAA